MKTQFKINGKPLHVPSGIHELTWKQFTELIKEGHSMHGLCNILTGMNLDGMPEKDLNLILNLCEWITDIDLEPDDIQAVSELRIEGKWIQLPEDLEKQTFGQKILVNHLVNEGFGSAAQVVAVYLWDSFHVEPFNDAQWQDVLPKLDDVKAMDILGAAKYITKSIETILDNYKKVAEAAPVTGDEIRAGIEKLYKYGDMVALDEIAGGDLTKYATIEGYPWGLVLTKTSYNTDKGNYQERLMEIKMNKG